MDYDYVGKATSTLGIWLIRSNREKASGGPFFRSLVRGCSPIAEDLYEILYYNMGPLTPSDGVCRVHMCSLSQVEVRQTPRCFLAMWIGLGWTLSVLKVGCPLRVVGVSLVLGSRT